MTTASAGTEMITAGREESFGTRLARFRVVNAWWIRLACYALSILLLLGAWQALGNSFGILFVPFTTTMGRLWDMLQSGPLLPGLVVSGKLYGVTLVINIVVGVTVGLIACPQQADIGGVRAVHLHLVRDADDFAGAFRVGDIRLRVWVARAGLRADLDLPDPDRGDGRRAQHSAPASRRSGDFRLERGTALARRDRALCYALRDVGHQAVDRALDGRHAGRRILPQSRRRGRGSAARNHHRRLGLGARRHDVHLRDRGGAGRRRRT